ncbi:hypothetical protein UM93_06675 [Psychromicrobium lacuslunae]|uniref:Peptidase M20 dimerisation domain-containing protein n=1 Tax=Psychromicrobium lacuslunae TaxID=1618207 RepID=A0A0D4C2V1_9MICC|nr:hypothetical protein UM93_06675 [Psychromicrobium lacuslunae]
MTQRAAQNLSTLIGFRTVSLPDWQLVEQAEFDAQRLALEKMYPLTHSSLERERVGRNGLLFRWPGSRSGASRTLVLMAHLDVVPVDPDDSWQYPAFAGVQAEGYLWGRGALDDKGSAVAIFEAVESLLAQGFRPDSDVYLSFGADEEVGGEDAAAAVELLAERGVQPWLVVDEGGAVAGQAFPGVSRDAAMIGVAEKGVLNVALRFKDPGGHSSTPPQGGATARLARAITRLDRHPFPVELHPESAKMLELFAAEMSGAARGLLSRARRLRWPLARLLPFFGPEASAVVRTTTAVTQLSGSKAANALAANASATVNFRIAVGSSVTETLRRLRRIINDSSVQIEVLESAEPSQVSASDGEQFNLLRETVHEVFPDVLVAPYLVMAMTDSRHFDRLSKSVFRFAPFRMSAQERSALHAANERISLDTLAEGVRFYRTLLGKLG